MCPGREFPWSGWLHQIVITHDILLAGHGFVVAKEINGVHIAVVEMPAAVIKRLGNAMPEGAGRGHLQSTFCQSVARQMESLPQVLYP